MRAGDGDGLDVAGAAATIAGLRLPQRSISHGASRWRRLGRSGVARLLPTAHMANAWRRSGRRVYGKL